MSEMNEKDLEQVSGGASGASLNVREWEQKNCAVCKMSGSCSPDAKHIALKKARRALEEGTEYICSGARSHYSNNQ